MISISIRKQDPRDMKLRMTKQMKYTENYVTEE